VQQKRGGRNFLDGEEKFIHGERNEKKKGEFKKGKP
jgi:hypothetical protein